MTDAKVNEEIALSRARPRSAAAPPEAPAPQAPAALGARQRARAERPGQILEAAFLEFAERGYAAARLEDVARRIGVTKGTIYFYFPSKEELFKAVCREHLWPVFERLERLPSEHHGSADELLRALLTVTYRDLVGNARSREFMRLLIGEASRVPELTDFYRDELRHRGEGALEALLAQGVASGEFRSDAVELLAINPDLLIAPAVLTALNLLLEDHQGDVDVTPYLEAHLTVVLDGLRRRAP